MQAEVPASKQKATVRIAKLNLEETLNREEGVQGIGGVSPGASAHANTIRAVMSIAEQAADSYLVVEDENVRSSNVYENTIAARHTKFVKVIPRQIERHLISFGHLQDHFCQSTSTTNARYLGKR